MPSINCHLDENKKLDGISQTDKKRYAKFKFKVANLGENSIVFSWREVRSGPFHRRFFKMLSELFDAQDAFIDPDMFRAWLTVGAGFAEFYPSAEGKMVAIPKSISYERLDQVKFKEVSDKVFDFVRSGHARGILWPHMSSRVSEQMVNAILKEYEQ